VADDALTHLFLGNFWNVSGIDLVIANSVETPDLFPALRFGEPLHKNFLSFGVAFRAEILRTASSSSFNRRV